MYSFNNDYSEIAHPNILELMMKYNLEQNKGYGMDYHSHKAKELIKKHISEDVDIHFLVGGTSCNKIAIAHSLKPYQAVISVDSGHINVSETGAIEANGHKILTAKGVNGKVTPDEIKEIYFSHSSEHMVMPKMVYISNSTEIGTIYTLDELTKISSVCKELGLYLFLDGARLGSALSSKENDLTLDLIAKLTDMFYIGGTKNGALLGEALIIKNPELKENIRYTIKRNGGLLAKGFVAGIQFEALFTDNLFFNLAEHANKAACILKDGLTNLNVEFAYNSPTNQQFIYLDDEVIKELQKKYIFEIWDKVNDKTIIRLVTSWATDINYCYKFLEELKTLVK